MPEDNSGEANHSRVSRRTILRAAGIAAAGSVGVAGTGAAEDTDYHYTDTVNTTEVGYHSLGGVGSPSVGGQPDEPHHGGKGPTELHRDRGLAFVTFWSSRDPTSGRAVAIVDVSDYTTADSRSELDAAEPVVIGFVGDNQTAARPISITLSPDGQYLYLGKEFLSPSAAQNGAFGVPDVSEDDIDTDLEGQGLVVFDISDPANPERVDYYEGPPIAFPGPFYMDATHIAGDDYLFTTKLFIGDPSALHIWRFDRDAEDLILENIWTKNGQLAQGTLDDSYLDGTIVTEGDFYIDVEVGRDEQTGRPLAYVTERNSGAYVLDVSEPKNIKTRGQFEVEGFNYSIDAATVYYDNEDGRRMFAFSQYFKNTLYLVDASQVLDDDFDGDLGSAADGDALATYTYDGGLENAHTTYVNFVATAPNEKAALFLGELQAGLRVFDVDADGTLEDTGYFRSYYEVPDDAKDKLHSSVQPVHRYSLLANGVGMFSATHSSFYAFTADEPKLNVGDDQSLDADIDRETNASVYLQGGTAEVTLTNTGDDSVFIRDRLPEQYEFIDGDEHIAYDAGDGTLIEFNGKIHPGESVRYYVDVGDETGTHTIGQVEYSGNRYEWIGLGDTDTNITVESDL